MRLLLALLALLVGVLPAFAVENKEPDSAKLEEALNRLTERQSALLRDLNSIDQPSLAPQDVYSNDCEGKAFATVNERYLQTPTADVPDFHQRVWKVDRIYRDLFREGTPAAKNELTPRCLYGLHKLAVQETAFHALTAGADCFDPKRDKDAASLLGKARPKKCDAANWNAVQSYAKMVQNLRSSIDQNAKSMNNSVRVAMNLPAAKPGCLNCEVVPKENCDEKNRPAGLQHTAETMENIKDYACCKHLLEEKLVTGESECRAKLDQSLKPSAEEILGCTKGFLGGVLEGLKSLNPVELARNMPDAMAMLGSLMNAPDKGQAVDLIMLALAKGFAGYDRKTASCLNPKALFNYRCSMVGQLSGVFGGGLLVVKAIKGAILALKAYNKLAGTVVAVAESPLLLPTLQKFKSTFEKLKPALDKLKTDGLNAAKTKTSAKLHELNPELAATVGEIAERNAEVVEAVSEAAKLATKGQLSAETVASIEATAVDAQAKISKAMKLRLLTLAGHAATTGAPGPTTLGTHKRAIQDGGDSDDGK